MFPNFYITAFASAINKILEIFYMESILKKVEMISVVNTSGINLVI